MSDRLRCNARSEDRLSWRFPLILLAAISGISGLVCLVLDGTSPEPELCRSLGGLLLLTAGAATWLTLWLRGRGAGSSRSHLAVSRSMLIRRLIGGSFAGYLVALCIGPRPGIEWLFFGTLSVGYTTILCAATSPRRLRTSPCRLGTPPRRPMPARVPAVCGRVSFLVLIALILCEAGLRIYTRATGGLPAASCLLDPARPQPDSPFSGHRVNCSGFYDGEFQVRRRPGVFRVAVLGDELILSGDAQGNCLCLLEREMPHIEIYNFAQPRAGPRQYAALLDEAVSYDPDLVLCFVSVGTDVTAQTAAPGLFDWRGLHICQLASRTLAGRQPSGGVRATDGQSGHGLTSGDPSQYYRDVARRMAVCRSPMPPRIKQSWCESLGWLKQLSQRSHRRGTPLGIVVLPGEFQVNTVLRETLEQRTGRLSQQIDLKLPQRRLALFADQRDLPMLDLVWPLQAEGASVFGHRNHQFSRRGNVMVADALAGWLNCHYGHQIAQVTGGGNLTATRVARTPRR